MPSLTVVTKSGKSLKRIRNFRLKRSTAVRGTHPSAADLDYQQAVYVELPLQPSGVGGQPLFRALEHPFGTF
jgi:hypothetical protein